MLEEECNFNKLIECNTQPTKVTAEEPVNAHTPVNSPINVPKESVVDFPSSAMRSQSICNCSRLKNLIYKSHFDGNNDETVRPMDLLDVHPSPGPPQASSFVPMHSPAVGHSNSFFPQTPGPSHCRNCRYNCSCSHVSNANLGPFPGRHLAADFKQPSARKEKKPRKQKVVDESRVQKPKQPYVELIAKAILSNPEKKMLITEIYDYMMSMYSCYTDDNNSSWKNSVRHNLSLMKCFEKSGRAEHGKGFYWSIARKFMEPFESGNFAVPGAKDRRKTVGKRKKPEPHMTTMINDPHWVSQKEFSSSAMNATMQRPALAQTVDEGMRNSCSYPTANNLPLPTIYEHSDIDRQTAVGGQMTMPVYDPNANQWVPTCVSNTVPSVHHGLSLWPSCASGGAACNVQANGATVPSVEMQRPKELQRNSACAQMGNFHEEFGTLRNS